METQTRPLDVVNTEDAKAKVSDVVVVGDPDQWKTLCKASSNSQRWMTMICPTDLPLLPLHLHSNWSVLDGASPIKDPALRHYLAAISQEVADCVKANNLVTWMTTRANDKAAGQAKVGLSANNESRAKANPVALYIGLGTTEEDKSNRIWHATVDKNRDGQTFSMRILGDLDHQRFGDLSEEMAAAGPPPGLRIREQRRQQARN